MSKKIYCFIIAAMVCLIPVGFVYNKAMERLAETYCNHKSAQKPEETTQGIEAIIQETTTGVFVWTNDFYTMDKIISNVEDWGCIVKLTGNGMEIDMSRQREKFMMHTNMSISYTGLLTGFMITTPKHRGISEESNQYVQE